MAFIPLIWRFENAPIMQNFAEAFLIAIAPDLTIEMAFQQTDNKGYMHNQDECATKKLTI